MCVRSIMIVTINIRHVLRGRDIKGIRIRIGIRSHIVLVCRGRIHMCMCIHIRWCVIIIGSTCIVSSVNNCNGCYYALYYYHDYDCVHDPHESDYS